MSQDLKITVLMTVFNAAQYLRFSIESILKQTFTDFQFLIIDDCSTDQTLEIIDSYKDSRIVACSNEKNLGQTASLNRGLKLAKGKYIARIDADDYAFPEWLGNQIAFIEQHPQCAVVSAKAAVIDSMNRIKRVLNSPMSSQDIILKSLIASPINHVGSLMRKDIVLAYGGYDERFRIAADYDLWSKLLRDGCQLASTNDIMVAIRFHDASISIIEKGKTDLEEMSKIMHGNVSSMTSFNSDEQKIILLWKLIYDVEALDDVEFQEADKNFQNVYRSIRPSFDLDKSLIEKTIKQQRCKIFIKRIFVCISAGDPQGVRLICQKHIKEYGRFNIFGLLCVVSFLGIMPLRILPLTYENFLKILSSFRLRNAVCPSLDKPVASPCGFATRRARSKRCPG